MENEKKLFCPILAIADIRNCMCGGSRCAWWVTRPDGGGHCAIQMLGETKNGV